MKTLRYNRVSSVSQNLDRQQQNNQNYTYVFEDRVSGTVPLFDRKYGMYIKEYVEQGQVDEISVHSIDRLARNLRDLLEVIEFFHSYNVSLYIENLGLKTLVDGKMNYTIKMIISMVGSLSEVENEARRDRQMEGIAVAKSLNKYKNRKPRGKESTLDFLQKHKQAVGLLEQGFKGSHVCKICHLNKNTVSKIKRHLNPKAQVV